MPPLRPYVHLWGSPVHNGGSSDAVATASESPSEEAEAAMLRITVGDLVFTARWEDDAAPETCAAFRGLLPFQNRIIQARWSGESAWIPLGDLDVGLRFENATSYPSPGEILLYPGGFSETEILFPYGHTCFASKLGQLAGNHFLTLVEGTEQLKELGRRVVWDGAQEIEFAAQAS